MYLKDPNTKVSYSFRIKPDLLEKLKEYSKATNQSLPKTMNKLLEESIKDINTNNTFLTEYDGSIINIPFMYHRKIKNVELEDEATLLDRGTNNYLDYEKEGLTYEVKYIPNNLDTWTDQAGYICTEYGIDHMGVNFVIVPELILNPDLELTESAITNCLKFIYFEIDISGKLKVTNISYKDCFRRLKEAGNNELLYKYKSIDNTIYKFSVEYIRELEKDPEAYTRYDNYRVNLYKNLVKFAKKYNDQTIVKLEEATLDFMDDNPEDLEQIFDLDFNYKDLTKVVEENQALKDENQAMKNNLKQILERIQKLEEK